MEPGAARRGGMPLYKYVGNRILTAVRELHGRHRPQRVAQRVPRVQRRRPPRDSVRAELRRLRLRHADHPAAARGGEADRTRSRSRPTTATRSATSTASSTPRTCRGTCCATGPTRWDSARGRWRSRAARTSSRSIPTRRTGGSSRWLAERRPSPGARPRLLRRRARRRAPRRTATRSRASTSRSMQACATESTAFVAADLEAGVPDEVGHGLRRVVAADVLEHVREPEALLEALAGRLAPGGSIVACVPNFGHWYPRLPRRARALRLRPARHPRPRPRPVLHPQELRAHGRTRRLLGAAARVPHAAARGRRPGRSGRWRRRRRHDASSLERVDRMGTALRPTLFAYQFLYELEPAA